MSEKPIITIPADEPPTDLQIEDETVGEGAEAVKGSRVVRPLRRRRLEHRAGVRRQLEPGRHVRLPPRRGRGDPRLGPRRRRDARRRPPPADDPAGPGYGARGAGGVIKGGETLVFVVDLVDVR
jgi:peptidylprolyl isomerase